MLTAGELTEHVIHKRQEVGRVKGVETLGAVQEIGQYWASIRFVSSRERWMAQQSNSTATVELRTHYRTDIRSSDWYEWGDYRLEVRGEPIPDQDRSGITVMCEAKRA